MRGTGERSSEYFTYLTDYMAVYPLEEKSWASWWRWWWWWLSLVLEPDRRLSTHRRTSFPSLIKVGDYRGISFLELLAPGIAGDRGRWRRFVEEGYFVYILYCGFF